MTPEPARPQWLGWIAATGEMGARVAGHDWAQTSLGPLEEWPGPIRGAVMLCLGSAFPIVLHLGPQRLLIYNDACRTTFGDERFDRALGRPVAEEFPETQDQVGEIISRVAESGEPFFAADLRVPINRAVQGEECYFTLCYNPIVGDDGETWGVLSIFVETTRTVVAERRLSTIARLEREATGLREEAELARVAMQVLADNAADHPDGAVFRAPAPGASVGEPLAAFGEPIECSVASGLVEACLAAGGARHGADDRLHAFPVLDPEQGSPTHVLVIRHHGARPWDAELETYLGLVANSLGAAMLAQAELWAERRRVARAEALDAAKSVFFAGVSHELRTPLSLIAAPVDDLLTGRPDLEPALRETLRLVRANVDRLTRLVDAMLDFSRMEAGRLVPNLQPADVSVLVSGLAASFAPAMQHAGLGFTVDTPDLGRPAVVDPDFLERIVLNLLSNAVKFTPEGGVTLRLADAGEAYEISVTDTGLGIDPAHHEQVFARFERLPPPSGSRTASGAGIGLAMVRQLTELLGGTVTLTSAAGAGSTFTVRIPFDPPAPRGRGTSITPRRASSFLAELDAWSPPARESTARADLPRLLLAEDDPGLSRFLSDALEGTFDVQTVADGAAALAAIRAERPDIVLSDLAMPGLDGLQLVAAIREDPTLRDLPVLLLTAKADEEAAAEGLGGGADDYIAKPFSMADLRARLAANLERARERNLDAAWRTAVLTAIGDGVLIFDADGLVLEMNQAVTDLFGYSMADGPIRPPYPWWPTEAEDPDALAEIAAVHEAARIGGEGVHEFRFLNRDREPVWVQATDAGIRDGRDGLTASVRILRDITRERDARERRAAAAQISADFASIEDLDSLLAVAEHGFEVLFNGGSTVDVTLGKRRLLVHAGLEVTPDDLPEQVRNGLSGDPSVPGSDPCPGILLVPRSSESNCRAWVQFPRPRRIGPDEVIVADLLAQSFALAVDRVAAAQQAADRESNLQLAMESHRLIGQAVGILVERHRLTPGAAFDQLKSASQNRNLRLRELARRVIESGMEPHEA